MIKQPITNPAMVLMHLWSHWQEMVFLKYIFAVWTTSISNIEVYLFIYNMWEDIEHLPYGASVKIEEVNK